MPSTRLAQLRPRKRTVFLLPMMFSPQSASALDRSEKQIIRDPIDYELIWRDDKDPRVPFGVWETADTKPRPRKVGFPHNASQAFPVSFVGGAILGVFGAIGGSAVGAAIDPPKNCYYICLSGGMVLGFLTGEIIGTALGAHAGNRARGSFAVDAGVSALSLVGGGLAYSPLTDDALSTLWLTWGTQLAITALAEGATTDWERYSAPVASESAREIASDSLSMKPDRTEPNREEPRPKHRPFGVWERSPAFEPALPDTVH